MADKDSGIPFNDIGKDGKLSPEMVTWLVMGGEPSTGELAYLQCAAKELQVLRTRMASIGELALSLEHAHHPDQRDIGNDLRRRMEGK